MQHIFEVLVHNYQKVIKIIFFFFKRTKFIQLFLKKIATFAKKVKIGRLPLQPGTRPCKYAVIFRVQKMPYKLYELIKKFLY
jgi:hypothetical protein